MERHIVLHYSGEGCKDTISYLMSVNIVNKLKGIQIDDHQCSVMITAQLRYTFVCIVFVIEPGEFVDRCLFFELEHFTAGIQYFTDTSYQNIRIKRFPDIVRNSYLESLAFIGIILISRQKNYGSLRNSKFLLKFAVPVISLKPVHLGHINIKKNKVGCTFILHIFKQAAARTKGCSTHIVLGQDLPCHFQICHIIIDNNNP